ncbi:MAG: sensor histidine kinase [Lachnospiraceae bacterium]|nr:sensor histidine kinase [Lachnospiraceae bacterium]
MNNIPNNTVDKIEFNFTCYALKLLGHNLYSNPWTAVSEIVANGIDAKAKNIYVLVELFDKETAQIEIIDNGFGMTYEDLCNKYTIIGRNKRIDNPNDKTLLGRKGVGKLAALFLSDRYYIYTKSKYETSSWCVDVSQAKDEDIPKLERYDGKQEISACEVWESTATGTAIKLTNVNLQKIGPERLKALPVILSDYYLADVIDCEISVCVRQDRNQIIKFNPVTKKISFSTMYAIFDNTGKRYCDRLQNKIYLTKENEVPDELDRKHSTLKNIYFDDTEGTITVKNLAGKEIDAEYKLTGWIGIHGSLDAQVQKRNDPAFNKISYHPNAIRLYVRGKLAVDNLMTYVNSSQAFANYIEGEINFDILDDDRFEDISTSNREGYKKDDVRVKRLLEIVGKIVSKLIRERADIGTQINTEYHKYMEDKRREEERKKKALQIELLDSQKREAIAVKERQVAERRIETERKRMDYIVSVSNIDSNNVLPSMHTIYNLSILEKKKLSDFKKYLGQIPTKLRETIQSMGEINNQIMYISKAVAKSNYLIESEEKDADICDFISEYIERVATKIYGNKIRFSINDELEYRLIVKINTVNIVTIIENIIGNSIKAKATQLDIYYKDDNDNTIIEFCDDGKGLDSSINNISDIFEFGYTTTSGAGLGLYYSKRYIEEMGGTITAKKNSASGLSIITEWER